MNFGPPFAKAHNKRVNWDWFSAGATNQPITRALTDPFMIFQALNRGDVQNVEREGRSSLDRLFTGLEDVSSEEHEMRIY